MSKHVAFLRGINVGKAKRVAMADLRRELEAAGFVGVKTLLQSGNVVFESARLTKGSAKERIETVLEKRLGVAAQVTVLTLAEVESALADGPFARGVKDPSKALVTFYSSPADAKLLASLAKQDFGRETLAIGKSCAWLECPDGILGGKLWKALDKALGDHGTARNLATLTKLVALARA
ncbi:MAG: DUF1697 domain-containing protein [Planctomycetota bacterium]|nr:DUF1697 domain-containing protein [Planctomycetota bacterium]